MLQYLIFDQADLARLLRSCWEASSTKKISGPSLIPVSPAGVRPEGQLALLAARLKGEIQGELLLGLPKRSPDLRSQLLSYLAINADLIETYGRWRLLARWMEEDIPRTNEFPREIQLLYGCVERVRLRLCFAETLIMTV